MVRISHKGVTRPAIEKGLVVRIPTVGRRRRQRNRKRHVVFGKLTTTSSPSISSGGDESGREAENTSLGSESVLRQISANLAPIATKKPIRYSNLNHHLLTVPSPPIHANVLPSKPLPVETIATAMKKNNLIRSITLVDGSVASGISSLLPHFVDFYTQLYTTQGEDHNAIALTLKGISNRIHPHLYSALERPYTEDECAFLSDRLIFDNIFIVNEIIKSIHYRKAGKQGWATIKLDMEKAFDKAEWSFVKAILQHVGFPSSFTSLVMKCLSTVVYRISVNGILSTNITPTRGIKQGDPMSPYPPYLFLLVVEGLSATIRAKEQVHQFTGLKICRDAPIISHILFADDSILFTPVTYASSTAIKEILCSYHKATGQTFNLAKFSIMFSPNTPHDSQDHFRTSLGLGSEELAKKLSSKLWSNPYHPMLCPASNCPLQPASLFKKPSLSSGGVPALTRAAQATPPQSDHLVSTPQTLTLHSQQDPSAHSLQIGQYTLQVDAALDLKNLKTGMGATLLDSKQNHFAGFSIPR
uniref:Reverse transcriptase domain-containing protein n=1 Tax=Cannabis sativa TaxID=3483 RepID=A0A803Q1M6_CANSA